MQLQIVCVAAVSIRFIQFVRASFLLALPHSIQNRLSHFIRIHLNQCKLMWTTIYFASCVFMNKPTLYGLQLLLLFLFFSLIFHLYSWPFIKTVIPLFFLVLVPDTVKWCAPPAQHLWNRFFRSIWTNVIATKAPHTQSERRKHF